MCDITGDPADVYFYGLIYWIFSLADVIAYIPMGYFVVPAYHREGMTSAYEVMRQHNNNVYS